MAARSRSKVNVKYKTKYKVENWAEYQEALRRRGDVTVWFDEGAAGAWNEQPSGLPGGQRRCSDLAILASLELIPYSIWLFISRLILTVLWVSAGFDLGPGASVTYTLPG